MLMTYIKRTGWLFVFLIIMTSTTVYAESDLLGGVDKQWLCDNQQKIYAGVDDDDAASYYHAGMIFFQGFCVIRDLPYSFRLFVKAAKGGYIEAYHTIALMSHIGLGTKKDLPHADKIFSELLKQHYGPTVRYACAIQQGEDERIKSFPPLQSLNNYSACETR
jgi:hypothetical protein